MENLIVDFIQLFGVTRPMAVFMMFQIVLFFFAAPLVIFLSVRIGFHAMHFDVLKEDVRLAKKDAERAAERAHNAWKETSGLIELWRGKL